MKTQIIMAGQGGQGILDLANFVSYYHLMEGKHVAFTPSYGPESRGGKVRCYVVTSDEEIDSPIVEEPDLLVVMNAASMDFVPMLRKGGTLFMNTSLISEGPKRNDIDTVGAPVTDIADSLSALKLEGIKDTMVAANSVMFGVYLAVIGRGHILEVERVKNVYEHFLTGRKSTFIPLNLSAVQRGYIHMTTGGTYASNTKEILASG